MILTRVQSTRPTAPGVKITLGPRNSLVRLSARPRGRSGWRAQIARPASRRLPCARPAPRRLPSALRRGKASPQEVTKRNAPWRLVRRLRGCGGLQKRVRGRRFGVSDAARPRDEEAENRLSLVCSAAQAALDAPKDTRTQGHQDGYRRPSVDLAPIRGGKLATPTFGHNSLGFPVLGSLGPGVLCCARLGLGRRANR